MEKAQRWEPTKQWRVVTLDDAKRDRRRKPWSVHDADHLPKGSRVMLALSPVQLMPFIADLHETFGLGHEGEQTRHGVISHRYRSGTYMVRIDGSKMHVAFERKDLIFPVPDGVLAFEVGRRRRRLRESAR